MLFKPTATRFPEEGSDDAFLRFKAREKGQKVEFVIYAYFECILKPHQPDGSDTAKTEIVNDHVVCGFAMYAVSLYPEFQEDIFVHSGPDSMEVFLSD